MILKGKKSRIVIIVTALFIFSTVIGVLKSSGHYIQKEHPDVVINAIKDIINTVRK